MIRKFECWQCRKTFEADDKTWVECPHCHSDNVEYATFHMPTPGKKTAIAAAGVVAVGAIGWFVMQPSNHTETAKIDVPTEDVREDSIMQSSDIEYDQPPVLYMATEVPEYDFDENGYSFEVKVNYPPVGKYKFVLVGAFDEKVIAESNDGKFEKIPYTEEDGHSYRVKLVSPEGEDMSDYVPLIGFVKQVKPATKMTVAQIQQLIDVQDMSLLGAGENDWLSPEVTLKFSSLPSGTENVPKVIAEVFDKLMMGIWSSVKVTNLDYDDLNRITSITLKVVDGNNDF